MGSGRTRRAVSICEGPPGPSPRSRLPGRRRSTAAGQARAHRKTPTLGRPSSKKLYNSASHWDFGLLRRGLRKNGARLAGRHRFFTISYIEGPICRDPRRGGLRWPARSPAPRVRALRAERPIVVLPESDRSPFMRAFALPCAGSPDRPISFRQCDQQGPVTPRAPRSVSPSSLLATLRGEFPIRSGCAPRRTAAGGHPAASPRSPSAHRDPPLAVARGSAP